MTARDELKQLRDKGLRNHKLHEEMTEKYRTYVEALNVVIESCSDATCDACMKKIKLETTLVSS